MAIVGKRRPLEGSMPVEGVDVKPFLGVQDPNGGRPLLSSRIPWFDDLTYLF
jgi:hypothetical protein